MKTRYGYLKEEYDKCECCENADISVREKTIDDKEWLLCANCRDSFIPHKDEKLIKKEKLEKQKKERDKKKEQKEKNHGKILRPENYKSYIFSKEWKRVRERKLRSAKDKCIICGGTATHVHHWRYPDYWGEENWCEIDAICRDCHSFLHDELKEFSNIIRHCKDKDINDKKQEVIDIAYQMVNDKDLNNIIK